MKITNLFIHALFTLLQIFIGVSVILWGVKIGVVFPIAFAGFIFLFNAFCGIISLTSNTQQTQ
jgi:hypothetical protein